MQLSGWVAQDAGLAQPENLGAHWQPQKEMLLCKPGTKETKKKLFQTSSISHGAWKLVRHITPPGALIFPHGSTREAASRLYSFNSAFPFTNSRQNWSHSFSSLWQCPKIPFLKLRERKETSTRLLSIISPRFFYVEAEIFVPLHCYHCFNVNVHHVLHREPSQFSNMQKTTQNSRKEGRKATKKIEESGWHLINASFKYPNSCLNKSHLSWSTVFFNLIISNILPAISEWLLRNKSLSLRSKRKLLYFQSELPPNTSTETLGIMQTPQ